MTAVDLYPDQIRGFRAAGREVLLRAEQQAGASFLLRVLAVARAHEPQKAVFLAISPGKRMREDYLEGPGGLWSMLEPYTQDGLARLRSGVIQFKNGSSIQVGSWESGARRTPDLLLVDDADGMGWASYSPVRERVLALPADGARPRIFVVSRSEDSWTREHWRSMASSGAAPVIEMRRANLPEEMRVAAPEPPPPASFQQWIERVMPDFPDYPHTMRIVDTMQLVADGKVLRLLMQAPPRYYKSLIVSRLFPPYLLSRYGDERIGLVSSTASLALVLSKDARYFYAASGGAFRDDSQDATMWRTARGGGMWARGLGGWALGVGYNWGLIDDPFSSLEEAQKTGIQEFAERYFWKTFYNRRELSGDRKAAIVVMHQRLDELDLAGRLLKYERENAEPEGWLVLDMPALKRQRREPFPPSCSVVPDPRAEEEPLCPELENADELKRLERKDAVLFAAIHLQEPFPSKGAGVFERWWWPLICDPRLLEELRAGGYSLNDIISTLTRAKKLPELFRQGRAWDFAASKDAGDATASMRGGVTTGERYVWLDVTEDHIGAAYVKDHIVEQAREDGLDVEVILPQEPAAAGLILTTDLELALQREGYSVKIVPTSGSKRARALPHAGAAKPLRDGTMGNVFLLPGPWNGKFREVHHTFDGVKGERDLVDCTAYLFNELKLTTFLQGGGFR